MKEYMQILIWTMLFVIVIEMIFPSSDFKKYLKLILGFIIVYTIFTPIIKGGFWNQGKYDEYLRYYQEQVDAVPSMNEKFIQYEQEMLDIYEKQEIDKMQNKLEKQMGLQIIDSEIDFDTTGYAPEIEAIYLEVSLKEEAKGQKKIVIPKIKIGEKDESLALEQDNLKKEIKNCLGDFYNWDNVNININVQGN